MHQNTSQPTVALVDVKPTELIQTSTLVDQVVNGLCQSSKRLPSKLLYDDRGSQLFEAICDLPEYYPTRTEIDILQQYTSDIAQQIGPQAQLIEFGSGWSIKTRILLDVLDDLAGYIPIDISCEPLLESVQKLRRAYPKLEVSPLCIDYDQPFSLPKSARIAQRRVAFFPGSTIGNFTPLEAQHFLKRIAGLVGPQGGLLIGVDLKKDPALLIPAYNDSQSVTAQFNLNLLSRLNRELGSNFVPENFRHRAIWNEAESRIEMHLVSATHQQVQVGKHKIHVTEGESICTEYSYKYTLETFADIAKPFTVQKVWLDKKRLFSVQFLTV